MIPLQNLLIIKQGKYGLTFEGWYIIGTFQ